MASRKDLISILDKMGVDIPVKMSATRIRTKLQRHLAKKGTPNNLTAEEKEIVAAILAPAEDGDKPKAKADKPKAKADKPKADKPKKIGALSIFKNLFATRKTFTRPELIKALQEQTGCLPWTAGNYIALAKKGPETFGFQLEETKGKEGIKTLKKMS